MEKLQIAADYSKGNVTLIATMVMSLTKVRRSGNAKVKATGMGRHQAVQVKMLPCSCINYVTSIMIKTKLIKRKSLFSMSKELLQT